MALSAVSVLPKVSTFWEVGNITNGKYQSKNKNLDKFIFEKNECKGFSSSFLANFSSS